MVILSIFLWWLITLVIGMITFPLAFSLFKNMRTKGYIASKLLGLIILGWLTWIFPRLKILKFNLLTVIISLLILIFISFLFYRKNKIEIKNFFIKERKFIIIAEIVFLVSFLLFVYIRTLSPDFYMGEKFMDFAVMKSIERTEYFPLEDFWFSGHNFNYYYFGQIMLSYIVKITNTSIPIAFNLSVALVFALAVVMAFSLGYNLTKKYSYALIAAFLVCIAGNIYWLIQISQSGISGILPFDYWPSSRIIQGTINEFPYFSFLHADLHAHMIAIPFTLLMLFISLSVFLGSLENKENRALKIILIALCLGSLYFINAWDFPTYAVILSLSFFFSLFMKNSKEKNKINNKKGRIKKNEINFKNFAKNIKKTIYYILPILILSVLLWLPSFFDFAQHKLPRISVLKTSTQEFMIVYALFFLIILLFLFYETITRNKKYFQYMIPLILILTAILIIFNFSIPLLLFALIILTFFIFFKNLNLREEKEKLFSILLLICSLGLLLITEYVYVYDVLAISWSRMNTVFKVGIQIWLLLAISCTYFLYYLEKKIKWKNLYSALVIIIIVIAVGYPILATISRRTAVTGTLNGLEYLKEQHLSDYQLILWLNENVKGKATILEGIEPDYYYTSPITSFTGLNGVMAWIGHEIQWNIIIYDEIVERINDVNETYATLDQEKARQILEKYDVDYVIIGENENRKYSKASLEKFDNFLELVYENEKGKIYKVK